jgi:hypothetical protein
VSGFAKNYNIVEKEEYKELILLSQVLSIFDLL